MIELIIEVIGEFVLQIAAEALVEIGFHSLSEPFRKPPNPYLAAFGYAMLGAAAGGVSLLFFPAHLVSGGLRLLNLVVTPIAVGAFMCVMGIWRVRKGQAVLRIDRFAYGYLFALLFALIRLWFAK